MWNKINTIEMHQFHKYAHGLHISILKWTNWTNLELFYRCFDITQALELCKPVQASQLYLILAKCFKQFIIFEAFNFASKNFVMILQLYYKK